MSEIDVPSCREIGRISGDSPGPTLIAVAAIHGNERAGLGAARRALDLFGRRQGRLVGDFIALAGNLGAARLGKRYVERDMNRVWTDERIADVERRASAGEPLDAEDTEQLELLAAIRGAIARARGPVHIIDLHTTSAHGLPFVLFGDTLRQRRFAGVFPLPLVMGLEEQVEGCLTGYWTTQGCITCCVEGGQHDDSGSVDNLEAVLLLGAESCGLLGPGVLAETSTSYALLDRRRGDLPRVMEVISRHAITPEDAFVMEPGYLNLARVRRGERLARDKRGDIRAPKDGFVMLPLYQGQGNDGYFWGREVSATRLRFSEALRHLKLDRILPMLPGVARDTSHPTRLVVDESAKRFFGLDWFHMFGYRRVRQEPTRLTVERQHEGAGG
jgi:hypothetical protein